MGSAWIGLTDTANIEVILQGGGWQWTGGNSAGRRVRRTAHVCAHHGTPAFCSHPRAATTRVHLGAHSTSPCPVREPDTPVPRVPFLCSLVSCAAQPPTRPQRNPGGPSQRPQAWRRPILSRLPQLGRQRVCQPANLPLVRWPSLRPPCRAPCMCMRTAPTHTLVCKGRLCHTRGVVPAPAPVPSPLSRHV